jgi:hypothetical protein
VDSQLLRTVSLRSVTYENVKGDDVVGEADQTWPQFPRHNCWAVGMAEAPQTHRRPTRPPVCEDLGRAGPYKPAGLSLPRLLAHAINIRPI